jgi:hypothetical protein
LIYKILADTNAYLPNTSILCTIINGGLFFGRVGQGITYSKKHRRSTWSFWEFGYSAFMITDTAFYRNPNYHAPGDTAETLDYEKMAKLVIGLYRSLSNE